MTDEKTITIVTNDKVLDVIGLPDTMTYTVKVKADDYNGWSNYATWRINLEIFDGNDWNEEAGSYTDISDFTATLKDRAEEAVTGYGEIPEDSLAVSYALSFLQDVNYYEIAKGIAESYPDLIKNKE